MALWAQLMSTKRELTRRELLLIREQEAEAKGVKDSQEYWAPVFDEEGEEEEVGEEEEEWEDDDDNGNGGLTIGESSTKTGESLLKTGESPSNTKREGVKDAKLGRGGAR